MDENTKVVFDYMIGNDESEQWYAETCAAARKNHQQPHDVLCDAFVKDMRTNDDCPFDSQELQTLIDWESIVRKLEYRQSLTEMAYL